MANQKGLPTGFGQTVRQEPESQRHKPDYEHWAGTRERAGHKVTGPEQRAGPKANRFQKIKGRTCRSLPHTCANLFCAIERRYNSK